MNRPLVEGGTREREKPFPFLAIFFPKQRERMLFFLAKQIACSQATVANCDVEYLDHQNWQLLEGRSYIYNVCFNNQAKNLVKKWDGKAGFENPYCIFKKEPKKRQGMAERERGSYPTQLCAMTEHRHVKKEKKERHRCNKSAV